MSGKKLLIVLSILALVGSCAGCGNGENAPSASANTSAPAASSAPATTSAAPVSSEVATGETGDDGDTYTSKGSVEVDGGQVLDLTLHGRSLETEGFYGISSIDVKKDGETIQTIQIHDAIVAEWGSDDFDGYTQAPTQDGGLSVTDMNFDGSGDIGLQGWVPAGANVPDYYWLWDSNAQQFVYGFSLCNASVDPDTQQIISATRSGADEVDIDYYAYDADGKLQNVKREVQITQADGTTTTENYELKDGELTKVD